MLFRSGADSFTNLLNRYRYLRMIAAYDRSLVDRIGVLETELVQHDRQLQQDLAELGRLRQTRLGEVEELRSIEDEHQRTLEQYRGRERTERHDARSFPRLAGSVPASPERC